MTGLIERLRALSRHEHDDLSIGDEAADEIDWLRIGLARNADRVCELTTERDALRARIEGAPTAKVRGKVGEICMVPVSHDLMGKRVALVVLEDGES